MRDLLNLLEGKYLAEGSAFPPKLSDAREIADYIAALASSYVDEEMIEEYYHGCSATLQLVPVDALEQGDGDHNIPSKAKEKRYAKMDPETMPPLIVQDGKIEDGNHRFRVAVARGATELWCYVINDLDEGRFDTESTYQYGAEKSATDYASQVWYHGTEGDFDQFDPSMMGSQQGRKGQGVWFAENPRLTGYYGPNQYKARLHLKNPLVVSESDYEASKPRGPKHWAEFAKNSGHDAVIIQDIIDGDEESTVCCIFDVGQIEILDKDLYVDESVIESQTEAHNPRVVLARARTMGFNGFGGLCGEAAVAINQVLFGGDAKIHGAFNAAFFDNSTGSRLIGHVAVFRNGQYWDADGKPKQEDDITSWGMLDPHDPDYEELAEEYGFAWNDETASEVTIVEFQNDAEVLEYFGKDHVNAMINTLQKACVDPIDEEVRLPLKKGANQNMKGSYAAFVCVMNPDDFIRLTTPENEVALVYADEFAPSVAAFKSGEDERYNKNMYGMPFLVVQDGTGKVIGHEGRHRAAMIAKEGGTKFPFAIMLRERDQFKVSFSVCDKWDDDSQYNPEKKEKFFDTQAEADAFALELETLNNDPEHDNWYFGRDVDVIHGGKLRGASARSNPDNWEYAAWTKEDMPPQLIGQFESSVTIPISKIKVGVFKGHQHFK